MKKEDSKRKRIAVLLAVFNGENHLAAQLDSLVGQQGAPFDLFCLDDQSCDSSAEILNAYASRFEYIHVMRNVEKKGAAGAFLYLLNKVSDYDYYFFCDQDDVWYPNKVLMMSAAMRGNDRPAMAFHSYEVEFPEGKRRIVSATEGPERNQCRIRMRTRAPGFSIVLNENARKLVLLGNPCAESIGMHDSWVAQVVGLFGDFIVVPEVLVRYRLHGKNTVGRRRRFGHVRFLMEYRSILRSRCRQLDSLLKIYGSQLSKSEKETLSEFRRAVHLGVWSRFRFVLKNNCMWGFGGKALAHKVSFFFFGRVSF